MKIAICIPASSSYQHALFAQAREIQANLSYARIPYNDVYLILGTEPGGQPKCWEEYKALMPGINRIHLEINTLDNKEKDYAENACLTIGTLRSYCYSHARSLNVEYLWSLDSDVIPKQNTLRWMLDVLAIDYGNRWDAAVGPYPSNGGMNSSFMFGWGTYERPILPGVFFEERNVPEKYLKAKSLWEEAIKSSSPPDQKKLIKKIQWVEKRAEKYYPPGGNCFTLNGKNYHRRGWQPDSFPEAGEGWIIGSSTGNRAKIFSGLGNNLFSKKAINFLTFLPYGYLQGTEDLALFFNSFYNNNLNMAAILECPAHHVVRDKTTGQLILLYTYHEKSGGDNFDGHLRVRPIPFYEFKSGDIYDPEKHKID